MTARHACRCRCALHDRHPKRCHRWRNGQAYMHALFARVGLARNDTLRLPLARLGIQNVCSVLRSATNAPGQLITFILLGLAQVVPAGKLLSSWLFDPKTGCKCQVYWRCSLALATLINSALVWSKTMATNTLHCSNNLGANRRSALTSLAEIRAFCAVMMSVLATILSNQCCYISMRKYWLY